MIGLGSLYLVHIRWVDISRMLRCQDKIDRNVAAVCSFNEEVNRAVWCVVPSNLVPDEDSGL